MSKVQPPLYTSTGELFQLVRVYYQVFNQPAILKAFRKLRCINFDSTKNRWVWLFEDEAKNLKLAKPHSELPKAIRPVVIGAFTFQGKDQMLFDVRSCERATQGIEFFDRRINRKVAEVTNLRIVNKLFEGTQEKAKEMIQQSPDHFFNRDNIARSGEALLAKMEALEDEEDINVRRKELLAWIAQDSQAPLPEVEEMPTHFYEDGIESLSVALKLRQRELLQRWNGNQKANMFDIIQALMKSKP